MTEDSIIRKFTEERAPLYDAHCHLQDSRLADVLCDLDDAYDRLGVARAVVNGTSPADWPRVLELAVAHPRVVPAIGLHPWFVNDRPDDWIAQFRRALETPGAVIGEIGLDRWVDGHDIDAQQTVFKAQLKIAAEHNLPATIFTDL